MIRGFSPVRPNAADWIADRAGRWAPNRSAQTLLNAGRSRCRSRMTMPTRTTSVNDAPAAASMASRLSKICSPSAVTSSGMAWSTGSAPNNAETKIQPPATTACGTGPTCAGASAVCTISTRCSFSRAGLCDLSGGLCDIRIRRTGSLAVDLDHTEAIELERHAATGDQRNRCGHPAGEDQLPGLQALPLLGEPIDQPGDGRGGMSHHGGAGRGHHHLAVDPDDAAQRV